MAFPFFNMAKKFTKENFPKPVGICIVGGYELHLYCANESAVHGYDKNHNKEGKLETGANNKFEAFADARRCGWIISEKKDIAICPKCAEKGNY